MKKEKFLIIENKKGWFILSHRDLAEVWNYKELLYYLTWRDIKSKYRQTILGILWVIFQPVLTMVVFTFIFGRFVGTGSGKIPYPVFVFSGFLLWYYFSESLMRALVSIVSSADLVKKVYFPRVIIPLAAMLSSLIDFFICFLILLLIMFFYGFAFGFLNLFLIFFVVFILFLGTSGLGFWLAALNALYRDVEHIFPFFIRLTMFFTPVIYPVSAISKKYIWLLYLNPLTGLIESFRSLLIGDRPFLFLGFVSSIVISLVFFVSGFYFLKKVEKFFADVI